MFTAILLAAITAANPIVMPAAPPQPAIGTPIAVAPLGGGFVTAHCGVPCETQIYGANGAAVSAQQIFFRLDDALPLGTIVRVGPPSVASLRGKALAVTPTDHGMELTSVGGTLTGRNAESYVLAPSLTERPAIAPNRERYLVAWLENDAIEAVRVEADGLTVSARTTMASGKYSAVAIASNGDDWLLIAAALYGVDTWRIGADGSVSAPTTISGPQALHVAAVWDGASYAIAWNDAHDAFVQRIGGTPVPLGSVEIRSFVATPAGSTLFVDPPAVVSTQAGGIFGAPQPVDIGLPRIGAAAFNNSEYFVTGYPEQVAVLTDLRTTPTPFIITAKTEARANIRLAAADGAAFVSWDDYTNGYDATRLAAIDPRDHVTFFTLPPVLSFLMTARRGIAAIATADVNGEISLHYLDATGGLSAPRVISRKKSNLISVVMTWSDVAILRNVPPNDFHVTFASGRDVDLGASQGGFATFDGEHVVVVRRAAAGGTEVVAVEPNGTTKTIVRVGPTLFFFGPVVSDEAGHIALRLTDRIAIIDETRGTVAYAKPDFVWPDADMTWMDGNLLVSGVGRVYTFAADGTQLALDYVGGGNSESPRIAAGAIAYDDGHVTVVRIR